jgi:hypothetical protein
VVVLLVLLLVLLLLLQVTRLLLLVHGRGAAHQTCLRMLHRTRRLRSLLQHSCLHL